jgi:hypothetical protein
MLDLVLSCSVAIDIMLDGGSFDSMVCCDEILSASIVLLTLLRKEEFVQIFSNLNLVMDLMPSFLTGSVHDCSLTNFYSAYQYLFVKSKQNK